MDDLDDLLPDRPDTSSAVALLAADVHAPLRTALAAIERFVPDRATPEERSRMADLRLALRDIRDPIDHHLRMMDAAYLRAFAETGAKQLLLADGRPVKLEAAPKAYRVDEQGLHDAMQAFVRDGVITDEEADKAIHREVVYKVNHTALNTLAANRGDEVRMTIERLRTILDPAPLSGKVRFPIADRR